MDASVSRRPSMTNMLAQLPPSWSNGTERSLVEMAHRSDVPGEWCCALALAQGLGDPSALGLQNMPLLHGTLKALLGEYRPVFKPSRKTVCPLSLEEPWPELEVPDPMDKGVVHPRERLALWLTAAGADPWVKDANGWDALDWAAECGSRSVFDQLLRHPGCPPRAQLWSRTLSAEQRTLPWTHVAVNRRRWGWLKDLMDAGAPVMALDKMGWPAAAWAAQADDLAPLARLEALPRDAAGNALVQQAWGRRQAMGIAQGRLDLEKMRSAMTAHAPLSAADSQKTVWAQRIEAELAQKCNAKAPYRGGPKQLGTPEELKAYGGASQGFRHEVSRGAGKGLWSPVSAVAMAMLTTVESSAPKNREALEHLVADWHPEYLGQWLDAPIRPGLTPRGMLWWILRATVRPDQVPATSPAPRKLFDAMGLAKDSIQNLSAAVDACLNIAGGAGVGHDRHTMTEHQWAALIKAIPSSSMLAQSETALQRWADWWEGTRQLSAQPEVVTILRRWAIQALRRPASPNENAGPNVGSFALLKALVDNTGRTGNLRWLDSRELVQRHRDRAEDFLLLQKAHRANPTIGTWFAGFPFDSKTMEAMRKDQKPELVQAMEAAWLEMTLPPPSAPAHRPRM